MDFGFFYDEDAGARLTADQPVGGQISGGFWVRPAPRLLAAGRPQAWHRPRLPDLPPLRRVQHRAADGVVPRHRRGPDPGASTTGAPSARSTTTTATTPGPRPSRSARGRATTASRSSRARCPTATCNVVPTWGGSMFEALMVPLFVPEEKWGPRSWGVNHPLYVRGQIEHGLDDAQYGYWGFSPSNNPAGGYREYGVDALGMDAGIPGAGGYTSDQERTIWNQPYEGCRDGGDPAPTSTATAWSPRTRPSSPTATPRGGAGQPGQAARELRRLRCRRLLRRHRRRAAAR